MSIKDVRPILSASEVIDMSSQWSIRDIVAEAADKCETVTVPNVMSYILDQPNIRKICPTRHQIRQHLRYVGYEARRGGIWRKVD